MKFLFDKIENIMEKYENAGGQYFVLFWPYFQSFVYQSHLMSALCGKAF